MKIILLLASIHLFLFSCSKNSEQLTKEKIPDRPPGKIFIGGQCVVHGDERETQGYPWLPHDGRQRD